MSLHVASKPTELKALLRSEVPLSRYSTFQIGGPARFFSEPQSLEALQAVLHFAREEGLPVLGIGKGSNLLFPDEGFSGVVVTFIHFEPHKIEFDSERQTVTASSGVNLYRLALAARDAGFGGVEFLSHIPGTLGGALVMNAGFSRFPGKKFEIGNGVESVTVLTPEGEIRRLERSGLEFGYRRTNLNGFILLEARLKLHRAKKEEIQEEIQACFSYRNRVQDLRYPSAGSVFKNPGQRQGIKDRDGSLSLENQRTVPGFRENRPCLSSGQLIEKAGLKGKRIGGAMISDRHANFIVNVGGAKASDVTALVRLAQERVREAFGVLLEPEIRIV